ncbi:hypothetical protein ACQUW5_13085 [Legionella sp. CNM-1927-20]|uniref:hypothetical protein n=1 Tax=Legionella sp. CNM-1927-20 TaxID=3422221 RepID=UPI00403AA148
MMKKTFSKLESLPIDVSYSLARMLDNPNLANLSTTSKYHCFLFSPPLKARLENKVIEYLDIGKSERINDLLRTHLELRNDNQFMAKFLMHLAERGKFWDVERELLKNPELLLVRLNFTDMWGRTFKKITLFQYAWWSFNYYQCCWALYHFNKLDNGFIKARAQLAEIELTGITYSTDINGVISESQGTKYFDMMPLMKMYLEYDNQLNKEQASENIQLAEKQLPNFINFLLHDYTMESDGSFLPGRHNLLKDCIEERESSFEEYKQFLENPLPEHRLYEFVGHHAMREKLREDEASHLNSVSDSSDKSFFQCNII